MKKIRFLSLFLLLAVLLSFLVACDKSESVRSAFLDAGYELTEIGGGPTDEERTLLLKMFDEERVDALPECRILVFSKYRIPCATVFVFSSGGELKNYLEDAYATAKQEGRVRGNCYLAYAGYGTQEIFSGK